MAKLENYTGSVELISGIKQKNNVDFPLAEAHSIQVDEDDKRLDEALMELKNQIGNLVSKKQGTENSGKALIIDENGNVICGEAGVSADATLSEEGKAADAKATGDAISELKGEIFDHESIIVPAQDASANLLNPDNIVSGENVYVTNSKFGIAPGDNYSHAIIHNITAGHKYKVMVMNKPTNTLGSSYTLHFGYEDTIKNSVFDITYISTISGYFSDDRDSSLTDDSRSAQAPEGSNCVIINLSNRLDIGIYDLTEKGLLHYFDEYQEAIPEHEDIKKIFKYDIFPEEIKDIPIKTEALKETVTSNSDKLKNIDVSVWKDITLTWKAGYWWTKDGMYEQAPTDINIYDSPAREVICCTPDDTPIPVTDGEEYHALMNFYIDNLVDAIIVKDDDGNIVYTSPSTGVSQDTGLYFTIPENGTKLYINRYNNQKFYFRKKVYMSYNMQKEHDEEQRKNDVYDAVDAHYRIYKYSKPTVSPQSKGHIIFSIDDCRKDMDIIANVFAEYGFPLSISALPGLFKECASSGNETRLEVCHRVVENGGEILAHYGTALTNDTFTGSEAYTRWCNTKREIESYGFEVNGIILAGGTNWNSIDFEKAEKWSSYFYDYSDLYGIDEPYRHGRISMNGKTLDWFQDKVEEAIANKSMIALYFHDLNEVSESTLREFLEYLQTINTDTLEVTTYRDYYKKVLI